MLKRLLSLVLAALIAVPAPALPAQVAPPSIERQVAHGAGDAAPALPRLAQRLGDTIPPLYMLGGDDKIVPVASFNAATDAFPSAALSFSTTSLGYIFDSAGKWTTRPNNLLTQSNTFSNAAWTKSSATVASGAADPDGGTSAWTLTATGANGFIQQNATTSAQRAVNTIYVRRKTGTGNILLCDPSGSASVIAVTSSWQQFAAANTTSGTSFFYVQITTSGDEVEIYKATNSAVTYESAARSADMVVTTAAAYFGPRVTYTIAGLIAGLLREESRTWVALWNRDFTNAVWTKTSVTAALDQTGIDGRTNVASSLTASGANGTVLQSVVLASSQRATSAYVKRLVGSGAISMTTDGGATWTDVTAQIGASYARVTIPAQTLANPSFGFKIATSGDSIAVDLFGNENGVGPTTALYVGASSVTRANESIQFTGPALAALQGAAWTALVETSALPAISVGSTGILGLNASQTALYTGNVSQLASYNGSSGRTATVGASGNYTTGVVRSGVATDATGRSIVANGGTVSTDGNKAAPTAVTSADLGAVNGGTFPINGPVKSFAIYSQRLSDATLQAKSVVGASYAANDNVNPFAPKFAANDNLPVHWRIAL